MKQSSASWKVATIRGVSLKLHVSLLILLVYIMWIAAIQFPFVVSRAGFDPAELSFPGAWTWAFFFAIALFASVAIHEFGHVFVAQALGTRVRDVTLMMLGGVSQMEKIPEKPYAEFKLAIVGPLVSFAIAGGLLFLRTRTQSPDLSFFCYWVGRANFVLAVFNLLPAFPLDGGRALRSLLAARLGMVRGTQASVQISKVFAWALGFLGLIGFNFLLVMVAFFIYMTAQRELFFLLSRGLLEGLKAGEIGVRCEALSENSSLSQAAARMVRERQTVLPVLSRTGLASLVSLDSLKAVEKDLWSTTEVGKVSTEAARIIEVSDPVNSVLQELSAAPFQAFPLAENGQVVGVLKLSDVMDLLQLKSIEEGRDRQEAA